MCRIIHKFDVILINEKIQYFAKLATDITECEIFQYDDATCHMSDAKAMLVMCEYISVVMKTFCVSVSRF